MISLNRLRRPDVILRRPKQQLNGDGRSKSSNKAATALGTNNSLPSLQSKPTQQRKLLEQPKNRSKPTTNTTTEYVPRRSSKLSEKARSSIRPDGNTWVELLVHSRRKPGNNRSLFYCIDTRHAYWEEPPTGASEVVTLVDFRRRNDAMGRVRQQNQEQSKEEEEEEDAGGGGGGAAARRSGHDGDEYNSDADADDEGEGGSGIPSVSNRKRREMERPTVAELKNRVKRSDLVEAHDVTAMDPDFLIELKSVPGTVAVPRHWGRKRKYLQGKRGIEKPPFQLPDFIVATGICDVRDAASEDQDKMSLKQKNRARVSGRGGMDVDYRVLHDAFFKHQTKPKSMTKFGDLYYEGKEFETKKSSDLQVGKMSERLRDGLGMTTSTAPPPWLVNMQRYGPPPSYPNLKIPGLNAPLPEGCSYGYHVNGWGKPPVDAYGRPLYGGDPFGRPTPEGGVEDDDGGPLGGTGGVAGLITSDGKTIGKKSWGALPTAEESEEEEESSDEEEESSGEEMAESSEEEEGEEGEEKDTMAPPPSVPGTESVLPPGGVDSVVPGSAVDLRKAPGAETPMEPKQLYQVVEQKAADGDTQAGAVFKSDVAYVVPGSAGAAAAPGGLVPEGAESVLSKAPMDSKTGKRKHDRLDDEEDADDLGKKFKF
mmetsp:Transcript_38325/g.78116  ORF Transcript_38325/g.78116 Transcript_38325/m.78116 type:complete len:652 (-) Transcript_38325:3367-5322(-)